MMKYDVTSIDATPGEKITVTLTNVGTLPKVAMAHNFVLLKAGTDVSAFASGGDDPRRRPDTSPPEMADKVIAATQDARAGGVGHGHLHSAGGGHV